jgi:DNA repair protein RadC
MDKIKNQNSTIKTWSRDDKPREKLLDNGKETLSNSELLAIIISTGTKRRSALDLARDIIKLANNNVDELAKLSIKELITVPGIGEAKAINIVAAIEIGARVKTTKKMDSKIIKSSNDAYIYFRPFMEDKKFEEFWIVTLNQRNKVINKHQISEGGVAATIVDPRKIYKLAIEDLASGIILCHNHPSGALKPSNPDLKLTEKLKLGGGHLDIKVLDHLIISSEGYFSFADEGLI